MSTAKLVAQSRRRASGLSLRRGTAACSAVMTTLLVGCLLVPWSSNSKASASAPAKSITLGNIYAISDQSPRHSKGTVKASRRGSTFRMPKAG